MAWIPPVSLPQIGGNDYARELYGMISGVGDTVYGIKRDKIGDQQWEQNYARQLEQDRLGQSNADRNYALALKRMEMDAADNAAAADEYGLNVLWGRDADGNLVPFQANKAGGAARRVEFGDGFTPAPPIQNLDIGTGYIPTQKYGGGGPAGAAIPKEVAGQNRAEEIGAAGGKLAPNLPTVEASADRMVRTIDDLLADPALSRITGPLQSWLPNVSGEANRAESKRQLIMGGTFLQAYNDLRGAGQITEQEGQAAMQAYNKLAATGVNDADYVGALQEFRAEIIKLLQIARQKAQMGSGNEGAPQGGAPKATSKYGKVY